jgi:hypothetical protein
LHENQELAGYDVPVYWVLGSCRILAFIREGRVLSKAEGGRWGLTKKLPEKYHSIIQHALARYQGKKNDDVWNLEELDAFADYMTNTILRESRWKDPNLLIHEIASRQPNKPSD